MQPLDPSGNYDDAAVIDALSGRYGTRFVDYRYDRLSSTNTYIEPIEGVVLGGSVANNALADIKRTATFSVLDITAIDYLKDRIKPWARLGMPDGGWVEWPLGVFVLATPARGLDEVGVVTREVEAYDQLIVLRDDRVVDRYTIAAGAAYTTAISTLVATVTGITLALTPSALTLPTAAEWEPGTSKLAILNDLLAAINYGSATFDEAGVLVCQPYQSPVIRAAEYVYDDTTASVRRGAAQQTLDLYDVPNKIVLVRSEPDLPALTSMATNTSPSSPTSVPSRGRTIVEFIQEQEAADQATLDSKAARLLFERSQVYEAVEINTLAMPMHSNADVIELNMPDLSLEGKFSEVSWSLELAVGASMRHTVRRVVTV